MGFFQGDSHSYWLFCKWACARTSLSVRKLTQWWKILQQKLFLQHWQQQSDESDNKWSIAAKHFSDEDREAAFSPLKCTCMVKRSFHGEGLCGVTRGRRKSLFCLPQTSLLIWDLTEWKSISLKSLEIVDKVDQLHTFYWQHFHPQLRRPENWRCHCDWHCQGCQDFDWTSKIGSK